MKVEKEEQVCKTEALVLCNKLLSERVKFYKKNGNLHNSLFASFVHHFIGVTGVANDVFLLVYVTKRAKCDVNVNSRA